MLSIIQAAGWPIWPLIACSILALALVFERFVALKTARVAPPKLLDEAISVSAKAVPAPDVVAQLAQNSALGEVLVGEGTAIPPNTRETGTYAGTAGERIEPSDTTAGRPPPRVQETSTATLAADRVDNVDIDIYPPPGDPRRWTENAVPLHL